MESGYIFPERNKDANIKKNYNNGKKIIKKNKRRRRKIKERNKN
jgi:hypothetical protein